MNVDKKPVLILGIGNILMSDEGVGPHAIECLQEMELPDYIEILDGGTSGAGLIEEVADRKTLIVIDASNFDANPGAIFRCDGNDLLATTDVPLSLHEFGMLETLTAAKTLGCAPENVIIFGVQPAVIKLEIGLSDEVKSAVPKLLETVLEEAKSYSV